MQDSCLTIIIPTWNRAELLRGCLNSLAKQRDHCSVLVVDNGSTDSTQPMLKKQFSWVRVLPLGENVGFARAVNYGIAHSNTEFVALLNNDTEADAGWAKAGLAAFNKNSSYWFLASRIIDFHERNRLDSVGDCYNKMGLPYKRGMGQPHSRFTKKEPVLGASAGAAFYRRELFKRIGLFDEQYYMYLEDVDLSLRAQLKGFPCLYVPEAIVYHIEAASDPFRMGLEPKNSCGPSDLLNTKMPVKRPPTSTSGYYSPSRVYWITRNRWQLMVTYQPARNLPWLIYGWTRSTFFHLLKAGFFMSFLRGLGAGMARTPKALKKRLQLHKESVLTKQEICQLISGC